MWRADRTGLPSGPQREGAALCVCPERAPFPDAHKAASGLCQAWQPRPLSPSPRTLIPRSDASSAVTWLGWTTGFSPACGIVVSASVAAIQLFSRESLPPQLA